MEQPALKFYPIGIQTFSQLRTKDYVYIDKTEHIYRMTHSSGKYMFLSRPRRFGKSLLVSTLHAYFEGRKDLFQGLAIERLEKEWTQYPVLHFDMSWAKHSDRDALNRYLHNQLQNNEERLGIIPRETLDTNNRLGNLIMDAYRKYNREVVVLIDEYDAPLLDVMHESESLPVLRNVMRNFYSPLKAHQIFPTEYLQRAEQHREHQYGRAICGHLWNYRGGDAHTDGRVHGSVCRQTTYG